MTYKESYKIRGHEIDEHYLFDPLFIIHYFHDCYANYCTDMGLAAFDLQKEGKTWIMTEIKCDILRELPRWREIIDVETWTYKISGLRTEQNFRMFHREMPLAKGISRWVVIDERSRKPLIHKESREKMKCISEELYENYKFKKIPLPQTFTYESSSVVKREDLDFNLHLNSIQYIEKAIETIPEMDRKNKELVSIHAKYRKEIPAGEKLKSFAEIENQNAFHVLKNEENQELFRMHIEWK